MHAPRTMESIAPDIMPIKKEGEGAFGIVLKGKDNQTGKEVAIKRIRKAEKKASRECEILRMLSGVPYCIQLYESFITIDDQGKYIQNFVFEFVESSLETFISKHHQEKKPILMVHAKKIIKQMLLAFKEIHKKKICHRDLKPDNILLDRNLNIKICDFGAAKIIDDEESEENVPRIVARSYRPPELILAHAAYGQSVDMWSIGCIIYEILTLSTAFEAATDGHMFFEVCNLIGTPTEDQMKYLFKGLPQDILSSLRKYVDEAHIPPIDFFSILPVDYTYSERKLATDLLSHLLRWVPMNRYTAEQCLKHKLIADFQL